MLSRKMFPPEQETSGRISSASHLANNTIRLACYFQSGTQERHGDEWHKCTHDLAMSLPESAVTSLITDEKQVQVIRTAKASADWQP